jgi:hypothetical protein
MKLKALAFAFLAFTSTVSYSSWCVNCPPPPFCEGMAIPPFATWVFCGSEDVAGNCKRYEKKVVFCANDVGEPVTQSYLRQYKNNPGMNCDPGIDCY